MTRFVFIYLIFVLLIAATLFRDLVADLFRGMSPLESMQQIVNYLLHIAVITILGSFFFGFYKVIQGWRRFARGLSERKRVQLPVRTKAATPRRGRRLSEVERLFRLFVLMQRVPPPSRGREQIGNDPDSRSGLRF